MVRRYQATGAGDAAALRHATNAERLDRLRTAVVPWFCAPAFVAIAGWVVYGVADAGGSGASGSWRWLPYVAAVALSIASPVFVAIAAVLTAVSTKHRPLAQVRASWMLVGVAALGAAAAIGLLARHMGGSSPA
jgi:hypothetical protein